MEPDVVKTCVRAQGRDKLRSNLASVVTATGVQMA